jgi:hypothetical protein
MDMKEDITSLPEFTIEKVVSSLSQVDGWGIKKLNIPDIWKKYQGENVKIAVIDTGLPVHQDIGSNAIEGVSCIDGEAIEDLHGHQTHCVGIISAQNNEFGMVGVAPKSKCLCIKGLSNSGSGSMLSLKSALEYCLEQNVDIISLSLGSAFPYPEVHNVIKEIHQKNIPIICAAGNSGYGGVNYPAAYEECIAVAAFDKYDNVAHFSSRGKQVEIAAPGVRVYSTYLNNEYASLSGTSMACPFVAGVVALLISKFKADNEQYDLKKIRDLLSSCADDKGIIGRDSSWGYGIIDPKEMIFGEDEKTEPEPEPEDPEPEPEPEPEDPEPEPEPEPEDPEPEPEPEPEDPEPEPEPEPEDPEPEPVPEPEDPEPEPVPKPEKPSKIKYFIIGGVVLASLILFFVLSQCGEIEYVDWDQKFLDEINNNPN